MKTFVTKISAILTITLLLLTFTTVTSCKKQKTTHGTVHVKTEAGAAVNGAKVVLSANSVGGAKSYTGSTGPDGVAKFDVPLPGIWDVTVNKDSLNGSGVLRLDEPGKSDETTVIIR